MSDGASDHNGRVILAAMLAPILGGAIIYYSLRKDHRDIANLGNRMSWLAFVLWTVISAASGVSSAALLAIAQVLGIALAVATVGSIKKTATSDGLIRCAQCGQLNRAEDASCIGCEATVIVHASQTRSTAVSIVAWIGVVSVVLGFAFILAQRLEPLQVQAEAQAKELASVYAVLPSALEGEQVRSVRISLHKLSNYTILGVHWTPNEQMTETELTDQMDRVWSKLGPSLQDNFDSVVLIPRKDKHAQTAFLSFEDTRPLTHKVYGQPLSSDDIQAVVWPPSNAP